MKKRISKTRQTRMREEKLKSTPKFGMKLVLILTVVTGCVQLFFYGKNVVTGRSNGSATRIVAKNSEVRNDQSSSVKTRKQENVLEPPLSDSEKGRQRTPETIAPFIESGDGSGNVTQVTPPSGDASPDPADDRSKLLPVSGPADASEPMTAFIFDDDPCYNADIRILGTLQAYRGRTTFFIVGSCVSNYEGTLKRTRDPGSGIGSHIFNHKSLKEISPEEIASRIEMTNDTVEAVTGFWPKLVRVPYDTLKSQVPGLVSYPMTQQDIDTQDWSSRNKGAIVTSTLPQARDGNVALIHDPYPITAKASGVIIPLLTTQEYQFITISEMYTTKGVSLEAEQVYFNIPNWQGRQICSSYLVICFIQIQ